MNPQPLKNVNADVWDKMMEEAFIPASGSNRIISSFSNAGGKRRTCGGRPKCLVNCGKDKNKNKPCCQNLQSWVRCVDELRKQNVSAGVPADTGVYEETTPTPTPDQTESGGYPEKGPSTMDTTTKVLIGTGIVVVLLVGGWYVVKGRKGKVVKTAPPVVVAQ